MTAPAVAIISPSEIREHMLGPSLRYEALARILGAHQPVTLIAPNPDAPRNPLYETRHIAHIEQLEAIIASHPVLVTQGYSLVGNQPLQRLISKYSPALAIDTYSPIAVEALALADPADAAVADEAVAFSTYTLTQQLRVADFIFCANERQRDYYLGLLTALGRVGVRRYQEDPSFRDLIDVVPFGLDAEPPRPGPALLKGVHPAIPADSKVLLWFGGIWNWLDAESVVRAFAAISDLYPSARLVFVTNEVGGAPSFAHQAHNRARALADSLGLLDRRVVFHGPVPSAKRGALMLEADIGLCFNHDSLETRLAYRTRTIDYIWAGLPMILGSGDDLGERVAEAGIGHALAPGDVSGLSRAMSEMLSDSRWRERREPAFATLRNEMTWTRVMQPLIKFCREPRKTFDSRTFDDPRVDKSASERIAQLKLDCDKLTDEIENLTFNLDCKNNEVDALKAHISALENGRVFRLMTGLQRRLSARGTAR
jgi:glycosyltransferase involved in cell wall biosynthesis